MKYTNMPITEINKNEVIQTLLNTGTIIVKKLNIIYPIDI